LIGALTSIILGPGGLIGGGLSVVVNRKKLERQQADINRRRREQMKKC
jgi:hypothetical protein